MKTGLYFDNRMLQHDPGRDHPEKPARLEAVIRAFEQAGIKLPNMPIIEASREDLLRVHTAEHIDTIEATCASGQAYPDPETQMSPGSWGAALVAAGAVISACRAVLAGDIDNAFCLVRPPGHHAEKDRAMGFCIFNNVAIGARWLVEVAGLERVAIVDLDVHHGNGTQQAFYEDPAVYFASIHQHPCYPGSGWPSERGKFNNILNIQMAPGSNGDDWMEALTDHVIPEVKRFDPQFLLISAGFDSHADDPLASQKLRKEDYARMTAALKPLTGGRLVSVLEGGYHPTALSESCLSHYLSLCEDLRKSTVSV